MNSLFRRFVFFGVGIAMGSFLVTIIFSEQINSCSYFPNERVLDEAGNKPWIIDAAFEKDLVAYQIDSVLLRKMFQEGKIDFNASEPRREPCGYFEMQLKNGLKDYMLTFSKCPNHIEMRSVVLD